MAAAGVPEPYIFFRFAFASFIVFGRLDRSFYTQSYAAHFQFDDDVHQKVDGLHTSL